MAQAARLSPRYHFARLTARSVLNRLNPGIPVDVATAARLYSIPIRERALSRVKRGMVSGREIVLNSQWAWHGDAERRWVTAEELGHILLAHSGELNSAPGSGWIRDAGAMVMEREAKVFAEELLMPDREVRRLVAFYHPVRPMAIDAIIEDMAERFQVTKTAMGYRLEWLKLIQPWEERGGGC